MNGKVIKIIIDHREYLFRLSSEEDISRIQQLATQLEKRIQTNKQGIVTTDYTKVLILTCLDLLEEINQTTPSLPRSSSMTDERALLKKLIEIRSLLKS